MKSKSGYSPAFTANPVRLLQILLTFVEARNKYLTLLTVYVDLNISEVCMEFPAEGTHASNETDDLVAYYRALVVEEDDKDELHQQTNLLLLAQALFNRFVDTGEMDDLTECIEIGESILAAVPKDNDVARPIVLSSLAVATDARFRQTGEVAYVDQSINYLHQALEVLRPEESERHMILDNLGVSLQARFMHTGQLSDIEESIFYCRGALALPSDDPSKNWFPLTHLCAALHIRFEETGLMEDLEECISGCRQALSSYPSEHQGKPLTMTYLGGALLARFERIRQFFDLQECISLNQEVLYEQKLSHFDRSRAMYNLARGYQALSSLSIGTSQDFETSIHFFREVLLSRPAGHLGRPYVLNSLGLALLERFEREGHKSDLDECITLHLEALSLRPTGNPKRYNSLANLSTALRSRGELTCDLDDLTACISYARESVSLCPPGHYDRCIQLHNLATALQTRYRICGAKQDLHEALHISREAATDCMDVAQPHKKATTALLWAQTARSLGNQSEVFEAYRTFMQLLREVLVMSPTLEVQSGNIWGTGTAVRAAASFAIEVGHIEIAVEMLELGRALLWSQVRRFRTPLDDLGAVNKELQDSFISTSRALETLSMRSMPTMRGSDVGQDSFGEMLAQKRKLTAQLSDITTQICSITGFEDFFKAKPFNTLKMAAAEGPVIVVNHSEHRSDAIIILYDRAPVNVSLSDSFYNRANSLPRVGTVGPSDGDTVGGAAPASSQKPYDRFTPHMRHTSQRRLIRPTPASRSWS